MADITLSSGSICKPFRTPWGGFQTRHFTVSTGVSSAAIYAGQKVTLDYTEAGNTSNAASVKASTADACFYIAGIAAGGASGSTAVASVTTIPVYEANPLAEFSAATKNGTLGSSHIGLCKTLAWDSTLNIEFVDLVDSTAANYRVVLTQLIDAQGDSGGRVAFRFISNSFYQGSTIASSTPYLAFYR